MTIKSEQIRPLTFYKVYLQYVLNYPGVVIKQGLLSSQKQCSINMVIGLTKNSSLASLKFIQLILIAKCYAERGHIKYSTFLCLYQLTPIWFDIDFLEEMFDFWKSKLWQVVCKRNCVSEIRFKFTVFQENGTFYGMRFFFFFFFFFFFVRYIKHMCLAFCK